jgi:DNA polymerase III epsilon subunit-like protein
MSKRQIIFDTETTGLDPRTAATASPSWAVWR